MACGGVCVRLWLLFGGGCWDLVLLGPLCTWHMLRGAVISVDLARRSNQLWKLRDITKRYPARALNSVLCPGERIHPQCFFSPCACHLWGRECVCRKRAFPSPLPWPLACSSGWKAQQSSQAESQHLFFSNLKDSLTLKPLSL